MTHEAVPSESMIRNPSLANKPFGEGVPLG